MVDWAYWNHKTLHSTNPKQFTVDSFHATYKIRDKFSILIYIYIYIYIYMKLRERKEIKKSFNWFHNEDRNPSVIQVGCGFGMGSHDTIDQYPGETGPADSGA